MPNLTGKTLAELRAMPKADIVVAMAGWLEDRSKKELIEFSMDATEFADKPEIASGEYGTLTRDQAVRDALGDMLRVERMEWTYCPTGEVDEIITVIKNVNGDEIDDGLINHYLDKQPIGHCVLTIALAPADVSGISAPMRGEYWKLIDIGSQASLWAVDAPASVLLDLHRELWAMNPTQTFGVLAVASARGNFFLPKAVRHHANMSAQEALARRDRIADYLDALGKDTTELRAATNEHLQMIGVAYALGYEMLRLWAVMKR